MKKFLILVVCIMVLGCIVPAHSFDGLTGDISIGTVRYDRAVSDTGKDNLYRANLSLSYATGYYGASVYTNLQADIDDRDYKEFGNLYTIGVNVALPVKGAYVDVSTTQEEYQKGETELSYSARVGYKF